MNRGEEGRFSVQKREGRIKRIVFILFLVAFCTAGYRIYRINVRYPSPGVQTGGPGDSVWVGSYRITFSGWQWSDGTLLQELCPGFSFLLDEDGKEYPADRERVGSITLTITKDREDDSILDLTDFAFESGAWGNQFDMELFYLLNSGLGSLRLQLQEGECKEIIFPMTMLDQQFTERDWEHIDQRQFYIVVAYYPEKLQFRCR